MVEEAVAMAACFETRTILQIVYLCPVLRFRGCRKNARRLGSEHAFEVGRGTEIMVAGNWGASR